MAAGQSALSRLVGRGRQKWVKPIEMHGLDRRYKSARTCMGKNVLGPAYSHPMTNLYFSLFSFSLTWSYKLILVEPNARDPIYFFLRKTRETFQVWAGRGRCFLPFAPPTAALPALRTVVLMLPCPSSPEVSISSEEGSYFLDLCLLIVLVRKHVGRWKKPNTNQA